MQIADCCRLLSVLRSSSAI